MTTCPCCSSLEYDACCGPYLAGERPAPTAEALMRSRYTAFAKGDIEYIHRTRHPRSGSVWDEKGVRRWSLESKWLGLEIIATEKGGEGDDEGTVDFLARYVADGEKEEHREKAAFLKDDGVWYFVDGEGIKGETFVRSEPKIGRNDPCPCGSGRKYKKCCQPR